MSVKEYLGTLSIEELEYIRLLVEIDPSLTVLQLIQTIKKLRNEDAKSNN